MRTSHIDIGKRMFDLTVAIVLIVVTLPVLVVATVGSTIALRTWPFFTQTRVGLGGERFRFVKLRTLPRDAPRYISKCELAYLRVPWFSQVLRRSHIDELPQLLLVIRGRMSLVGPRPEMPYLHEATPDAVARMRTSIRPGCTGLWQVSKHCTSMIHEHPEMDAYYVEHQTLRLDLWILFQTLQLMLLPTKRLVGLDDVPVWVLPAMATNSTIDLDALVATASANKNSGRSSTPARDRKQVR